MQLVLLLPPSEGKAEGGDGIWVPNSGAFASLAPARKRVIKALRAATKDDELSTKLLGLKAVALEKARSSNRGVLKSPALPAHVRYSGVVWAHMDSALTSAARVRAESSVVVVSGLMGLAGWNDPVPDYKLKVGVSLGELGMLSTYWAPVITRELNREFPDATFVDLLPNDYRKAINFDSLLGPRVKVDFVDRDRGAVGHNAKATKGLFAAHVLRVGDPFKAARTFDAADLKVVLS